MLEVNKYRAIYDLMMGADQLLEHYAGNHLHEDQEKHCNLVFNAVMLAFDNNTVDVNATFCRFSVMRSHRPTFEEWFAWFEDCRKHQCRRKVLEGC